MRQLVKRERRTAPDAPAHIAVNPRAHRRHPRVQLFRIEPVAHCTVPPVPLGGENLNAGGNVFPLAAVSYANVNDTLFRFARPVPEIVNHMDGGDALSLFHGHFFLGAEYGNTDGVMLVTKYTRKCRQMHISGDAIMLLFVFTNLTNLLFAEICSTSPPFVLVTSAGLKPATLRTGI